MSPCLGVSPCLSPCPSAELAVARRERAQELRERRQAVAAAEEAAVTVALQSARDAHRDQLEHLQHEKVRTGQGGTGIWGCGSDFEGMVVRFWGAVVEIVGVGW